MQVMTIYELVHSITLHTTNTQIKEENRNKRLRLAGVKTVRKGETLLISQTLFRKKEVFFAIFDVAKRNLRPAHFHTSRF